LIDHENLASAAVRPDGKLAIRDHSFATLLLPDDVKLPPKAAEVVDAFRQSGGRVLVDGPPEAAITAERLMAGIRPPNRIAPPSDRIALGQFARDGRAILLVVNVGQEAYQGQLTSDAVKAWRRMDPATGAIKPVAANEAGQIRLDLAARQAVLLVERR
jgi:hypothetical protein